VSGIDIAGEIAGLFDAVSSIMSEATPSECTMFMEYEQQETVSKETRIILDTLT
jgi:hypothetical protein